MMTPKLAITYRSITHLVPYARNARTHSDAQVAQIVASIREFGWTNPILVDGANNVIAGHGRLLAARQLGMDEVPTRERDVDGPSPAPFLSGYLSNDVLRKIARKMRAQRAAGRIARKRHVVPIRLERAA
jgi:hypothetical protein